MSLYEQMGGRKTFENLVSHFYALVATDPVLRPMYPDDDFKGAAERLLMFLEQYWGGPDTYSQVRGHPRLRMRHDGHQLLRTNYFFPKSSIKNGKPVYMCLQILEQTIL